MCKTRFRPKHPDRRGSRAEELLNITGILQYAPYDVYRGRPWDCSCDRSFVLCHGQLSVRYGSPQMRSLRNLGCTLIASMPGCLGIPTRVRVCVWRGYGTNAGRNWWPKTRKLLLYGSVASMAGNVDTMYSTSAYLSMVKTACDRKSDTLCLEE